MTNPVIHQPSENFWTLYGHIRPELTPDDCRHLIQSIAAELGCTAEIVTRGEQMADATDDLNEVAADDRPAEQAEPWASPELDPDPEPPKVKDAVDMLYGQCRLTGRRGRPLPRLVSVVKPKEAANK